MREIKYLAVHCTATPQTTSVESIKHYWKAQKKALFDLLKKLKKQFPKAIIQGHRDFPGVKKACPSFNAKEEYEHL